MTVLEDVEELVMGMAPKAICDDCIATKLHLSVRQHANHKTRELAGFTGFDRRKDTCSKCGAVKMVIRHLMDNEIVERPTPETNGQAEALEYAFVSLVRLLGDAALRDRLATVLQARTDHVAMETLQATNMFNATLERLAEELLEPDVV